MTIFTINAFAVRGSDFRTATGDSITGVAVRFPSELSVISIDDADGLLSAGPGDGEILSLDGVEIGPISSVSFRNLSEESGFLRADFLILTVADSDMTFFVPVDLNALTLISGPIDIGLDRTFEIGAEINPSGPLALSSTSVTNTPPVAVSDGDSPGDGEDTGPQDEIVTDEETPITIDVLANDLDADGDTLAVVSASNGRNGSVIVNADGTVTYTPNADFFGSDSFTYTISDGRGGFSTASVFVTVNDVAEAINGTNRGEFISGTQGNDVIDARAGNDTVNAGSGDDNVLGGSGRDFINGETGDDTLNGENGRDRIEGGSGNDVILGGGGRDFLIGGTGNDTVEGESGADTINGGTGDDNIEGGTGADSLAGGDGLDMLFGQDGADMLFGGDGDDFVSGGDGNDSISGGAGADEIETGSGSDEVVFEAGFGIDIVVDFNPATDLLDLRRFGIVSLAGIEEFLSEADGDTIINFDGSNIITLRNITADSLSDGNFVGSGVPLISNLEAMPGEDALMFDFELMIADELGIFLNQDAALL